jgi:PAS domain S-box-containing protein
MPGQVTTENFARLSATIAALQTDNALLRGYIETAAVDAHNLADLQVTAAAAQHRQTKIDRAALASSRRETQDGLSSLLVSGAALASSRAETKLGQTDLRASEVVNNALNLANALLVTSKAALAESEARLRAVIDTTPECIMLISSGLTLLQVNRAGLRTMEAGTAAAVEGSCVLGFIAPEHRQTWQANHERVCRGDELKWDFDLLGLLGGLRRMETHATPLKLLNGETAQLAISRDVTEQRRTEELQTLLSREVDHRAKNVLAVVLSFLRMTPRDDVTQFAASVEGRVGSMARAHSILSAEGWAKADLQSVAAGELTAHVGHYSISGPAVSLKADVAQPMAIVLHELATNATKYGSLKHYSGRVDLSWDMAGKDGGLRLRWQEHGGTPLQTVPAQKGFGLRLIERLVTRQLSGSVCSDWQELGLLCTIEIPARHTVQAVAVSSVCRVEAAHAAYQPGKHAAVRSSADLGLKAVVPRILVVEDEALLALELEDTLSELGYDVVTAGTLAEAVSLAVAEPNLSAAILDVNLGNDERSFPIVDLLQTRGVPYILATGYGSAASLNGYDHNAVAVLAKPYPREALDKALKIALQ